MKQQRTIFGFPLSWWIIGGLILFVGCPIALVIGLGIVTLGSVIGPLTIGGVVLFAVVYAIYDGIRTNWWRK